MLKLSRGDTVDFDTYEENIGYEPFVYVDPYVLSDLLDEMETIRLSREREVIDLISHISNGTLMKATWQTFINVLMKYCAITEAQLTYRQTGEISSREEVRTILARELRERIASGKYIPEHIDALRIIEAYDAYRNIAGIFNLARKKYDLLLPCEEVGWAGQELMKVPFVYEQKVTMRYCTADDNLQGWPRDILSVITVPKGKYLWWGDFAQIDLRVFLNTIMRYDPSFTLYLEKYTDKYEAFVRYMYDCISRPFILNEFKDNRDKYKVAVLSIIYGTSEATLIEALDGDKAMAATFMEFFDKNIAYQTYLNSIKSAAIVDKTCITMEDYFGVKSTIETNGHLTPHNLNQCINRPIQCGSNSIVVLWINHVIAKFRSLGYGPDDVGVVLIRHDEGILYVSPEAMKDIWILENARHIQIDDWDTIELDAHMGIYYKDESAELMAKYYEICETNKFKFDTYPKGEDKQYRPIKPVVFGYMYSYYTPAQYVEFRTHQKTGHDEAVKIIQRQASVQYDDQSWAMYLKYYKRVSFYNPFTEKWEFQVPIERLLELDVYGFVIANATTQSKSRKGSVIFSTVIETEVKILEALSNNMELAHQTIRPKPARHHSPGIGAGYYSKSKEQAERDAKLDIEKTED